METVVVINRLTIDIMAIMALPLKEKGRTVISVLKTNKDNKKLLEGFLIQEKSVSSEG